MIFFSIIVKYTCFPKFNFIKCDIIILEIWILFDFSLDPYLMVRLLIWLFFIKGFCKFEETALDILIWLNSLIESSGII